MLQASVTSCRVFPARTSSRRSSLLSFRSTNSIQFDETVAWSAGNGPTNGMNVLATRDLRAASSATARSSSQWRSVQERGLSACMRDSRFDEGPGEEGAGSGQFGAIARPRNGVVVEDRRQARAAFLLAAVGRE